MPGDLSKLDRAEAVIVVGSDTSGSETNPIQIDVISGNRRVITSADIVDQITGASAEVTTARELRVTSETIGGSPAIADRIFATETYITTNTEASARPVSGDFDMRKFKTKTIRVKNIGTKKADVNIYASIDGGVLFDFLVVSVPGLNTDGSVEVNEERGFTHMRVAAKSSVAGQPTSLTSKGYALGT